MLFCFKPSSIHSWFQGRLARLHFGLDREVEYDGMEDSPSSLALHDDNMTNLLSNLENLSTAIKSLKSQPSPQSKPELSWLSVLWQGIADRLFVCTVCVLFIWRQLHDPNVLTYSAFVYIIFITPTMYMPTLKNSNSKKHLYVVLVTNCFAVTSIFLTWVW